MPDILSTDTRLARVTDDNMTKIFTYRGPLEITGNGVIVLWPYRPLRYLPVKFWYGIGGEYLYVLFEP